MMAQVTETVIYRIIIRGREAKPLTITSNKHEARNTSLSSFPLNLRFLNLNENIGILVISRYENISINTPRIQRVDTRFSIS